jgi:hypothetical protein
MTIYLYKKTHNQTGLQYLGKTEKDPHLYQGSGKRWLPHIKKHGNDVTTEILKECTTNDEVKEWGLYYSRLWNIVENDDWANLTEEGGEGGKTTWGESHHMKRLELRAKNSGKNHYTNRKDFDPTSHHFYGKGSGSANTRFDHTVYKLQHKTTGEIIETTRYDFGKKYDVSSGDVHRLIHTPNVSAKGWKLIGKL